MREGGGRLGEYKKMNRNEFSFSFYFTVGEKAERTTWNYEVSWKREKLWQIWVKKFNGYFEKIQKSDQNLKLHFFLKNSKILKVWVKFFEMTKKKSKKFKKQEKVLKNSKIVKKWFKKQFWNFFEFWS